MSIHRPTVLILASDPAFAREITAHWPHDPAPHSAPHSNGPEFIVLDQNFSRGLEGGNYDLAIADASSLEKLGNDKRKSLNQTLTQALAAAGKPAIVIHSDPALDFYNLHGAVLDLRCEPGIWPAMVGLIGREILRRR